MELADCSTILLEASSPNQNRIGSEEMRLSHLLPIAEPGSTDGRHGGTIPVSFG